jgi:hypothetical protein
MKTYLKRLLRPKKLGSILSLTILITVSVRAQTLAGQTAINDNGSENDSAATSTSSINFSLPRAGFRLMPAKSNRITMGASITGHMAPLAGGTNLSVLGSGTVGRLTKWTGITSSNSFIGDSTIFEDKFGKVGIGTDSPTSKLTVAGMIETTLGGLKFPDGSLQTTAAVSGLQSVFHNATLQGAGTSASPLGVAIPLNLTGPVPGFNGNVLTVVNSGDGGSAIKAVGGAGVTEFPGNGIMAVGGDNSGGNFQPGVGVIGIGGISTSGINSGAGVRAVGGNHTTFAGGSGLSASGGQGPILSGFGVDAFGGLSPTGDGGAGVRAFGGDGGAFEMGNGSGGDGVISVGGDARGAGKSGGDGIFARGGAGTDGATAGRAGAFLGLVAINGDLNVTGTKNFKIDHPLDPENKYLYHAAIESSEVLNIYSGNVIIGQNGEATVTLPDWFEALNKDFRYQLTSIGAPAQGLYIAEKVSKNRFKISGGQPGLEVSWQITGVRSDAAMLHHPFKAEQDKPEIERGTYLTPEAFGQPEDKGAERVRDRHSVHRRNGSGSVQIEQLPQKTRIN